MYSIAATLLFSGIGLNGLLVRADPSISAPVYSSRAPLERLSTTTSSSLAGAIESLVPADESKGCEGTTTITETQALSALSSCATYWGDITVASITASAQSSEQTATLLLDGVKHIKKNLVFTDLTGLDDNGEGVDLELGGPVLEKLDGRLKFLQSRSTLNLAFPKIQQLGGITYDSVNLTQSSEPGYDLRHDTGDGLSAVYIRNTPAQSVSVAVPSGIVATVVIIDNPELEEINIDNLYISSSPSNLQIERNGPGLRLTTSVASIESGIIGGCAEIQASVLASIPQWLTLRNNTFTILNLPALDSVGNFYIAANPLLGSIELPALGEARILNFTDNLKLDEIQLPQLSKVTDELKILNGIFTSIAMPALTSINAGVTIISDSELDCSGVQAAQKYANLFQVPFKCTGVPNATASTTNGSSNGHGNSLPTSARVGIGISTAVIAVALVAGFAIGHQRGRRMQRQSRSKSAGLEKTELDSHDVYEFPTITRGELDATRPPGELYTGHDSFSNSRGELDSPHGASELQVEQKCYEMP